MSLIAPKSGRLLFLFFLPMPVVFIIAVFLGWIWLITGIPFSCFFIFITWFFRDPDREIPTEQGAIVSPADGTVIYTKQDRGGVEIAIRMSPFNIHVNRSPIAGKILSMKKIDGGHRPVYFGDAKKNQRVLTVIESEEQTVELLQITGWFARRIENWVKKGDMLSLGQRIGIIRFGSQVNFTLKKDVAKIELVCNKGDNVTAGKSVMAYQRSDE